jgi:CheY-like chemotaxis protein
MQQPLQGLRVLSSRWEAAIEATNDPELRRHFAGHVAHLATPADGLEPSEEGAGEARNVTAERRLGRRAVVLVLEDDDLCRDTVRNVLRAASFDVICASNFNEAVSCLEDGAKIDIALVDVRMPAGTPHGISFARMALWRQPALKVIFMSADYRSQDLRLIDEDEVFLCKPFAPHQLLDVVTRATA